MPSIDTRVEVAVGLVYPPGDLHSHLRDALRDLGATIVYEAETANFDRSALERAGAQVVIVNLDPDVDEQDDAIDDLLVDDRLKQVVRLRPGALVAPSGCKNRRRCRIVAAATDRRGSSAAAEHAATRADLGEHAEVAGCAGSQR